MLKISFLLLVFLMSVINGLSVHKRTNVDQEDNKRTFYPGVVCQTNKDCLASGLSFSSTCLILPSTGQGRCIFLDEEMEKRSLSYSLGKRCQYNSDCFGFLATCKRGTCIDILPFSIFPESDESRK